MWACSQFAFQNMSLCSWWSKSLLAILLHCFVLFINHKSSTLKFLRGRKMKESKWEKKPLKSLRAWDSLEASISLFLSLSDWEEAPWDFPVEADLNWKKKKKNSPKSVCRATRKGVFLRSMKVDSYQNLG